MFWSFSQKCNYSSTFDREVKLFLLGGQKDIFIEKTSLSEGKEDNVQQRFTLMIFE